MAYGYDILHSICAEPILLMVITMSFLKIDSASMCLSLNVVTQMYG